MAYSSRFLQNRPRSCQTGGLVFAFHLGRRKSFGALLFLDHAGTRSFHPTIVCLLSLHQPAMLFPTNFNEAEVLGMLRSICIFSVCTYLRVLPLNGMAETSRRARQLHVMS
jgi:hypothetical protein